MADDMRIKVSTEVLVTASADLAAKVKKAQTTFQEIESIVRASDSYWEGDGHNKMKEHYSNRSDDFNRIFEAIRQHAVNLEMIAGVYSATERGVIAETNMLLGDIIE